MLALCGAVAEPASAQSKAPTQAAASLARYEQGAKAFEEGKFEEALIAFQASLELQPSPNTRLYIGRCHRAMGKTASAYTSLRLAAREAQDRLTATGEKRYTATRDTAASEAAEIEPKVPRLTLAIPSDVPVGFAVTLDGAEVPKAAWGTATETDPGKHEIRASGPRLTPFVETIELEEGAQKRVEIRAPRLPTATLALVFASRPGGMTIAIDGQPADLGQLAGAREVDVGAHRVVIRAPGYVDFTWQKTLADGDNAKVDVILELAPSADGASGTPPWLFFGVAGVALVGAGVGTGLAVHASGMASDEEAKSPYLRDPAVRDEIGSFATGATVSFIASGVIAAGAGVLLFTTDWEGADADEPSKGPQARLTPWIGPQAGGIAASGRF